MSAMKKALKRLFASKELVAETPSPSTSTLQARQPAGILPLTPFSMQDLATPSTASRQSSKSGYYDKGGPKRSSTVAADTSEVTTSLSSAWNGELRKAQTQGVPGALTCAEQSANPPSIVDDSRSSACRGGTSLRTPRRSLEVSLEKLPSVNHLAESDWTRALTGNIKSLAQAQGALGYSGLSNPASPRASVLGARNSAHGSRRRQSSTLPDVVLVQSSQNLPSPQFSQRGFTALCTTSKSLGELDAGEEDDVPIAPLPSVLPAALLQEAAKTGVSLEVDMDTEVVLSADEPLGRGASGTVYKATYKGQPCAVKVLPPDSLFGSGVAELHTFVQEVVVLASVRHPNIVALLGGSLQPPHVFLIAELCQTSLEAWLYRGPPMTPHDVLKVALDVAMGLQYLHELKPAVVHRDLKPGNILVDANGTAKISDFGLARVKTSACISTKAPEVGSLGYMAPECFTVEDGGLLTDKCDTWSLGVVLYELVSRKRPWPGLTMPEYYREVVIRKSRLQIPQDDGVCPLALRRLISSCWSDDPEERPSCAHIVAELSRMLKYCPKN